MSSDPTVRWKAIALRRWNFAPTAEEVVDWLWVLSDTCASQCSLRRARMMPMSIEVICCSWKRAG